MLYNLLDILYSNWKNILDLSQPWQEEREVFQQLRYLVDEDFDDTASLWLIISGASLINKAKTSTNVLARIATVVVVLSLQLILLNNILFGSFLLIIYAGAVMVMFVLCLLVFGTRGQLYDSEEKLAPPITPTTRMRLQFIIGNAISWVLEDELEARFYEMQKWTFEGPGGVEYSIHTLANSLITQQQYVILSGCVLIASMLVIMKLTGENTNDHA